MILQEIIIDWLKLQSKTLDHFLTSFHISEINMSQIFLQNFVGTEFTFDKGIFDPFITILLRHFFALLYGISEVHTAKDLEQLL